MENLDEKIEKMLDKGEFFCDHFGSIVCLQTVGGVYPICTRCWKRGKAALDTKAARLSFMAEANNNIYRYYELKKAREEKTMSSDYEAGYKKGVEEATSPLRYAAINLYGGKPVSDVLFEVRKQLLTKKVTKYAVVLSRSRGPQRARAYYIYGDLHDGRASAEHDAEGYKTVASEVSSKSGLISSELHGVFPIEIEIPL